MVADLPVEILFIFVHVHLIESEKEMLGVVFNITVGRKQLEHVRFGQYIKGNMANTL